MPALSEVVLPLSHALFGDTSSDAKVTLTSASSSSSASLGCCSSSGSARPYGRWKNVKSLVFGHFLASSFQQLAFDQRKTSSSCASSSSSSSDHLEERLPSAMQNQSDEDDEEEEQRQTVQPTLTMAQSSEVLANKKSLQFEMVQLIGSGSYGTVLLSHVAQHPDQMVAIKMVSKRQLACKHDSLHKEKQRVFDERDVLVAVKHPFITKLYCAFESTESLNFVMEYCAGGDLYFMLEKFPEHRLASHQVVFYAASIALTLNYLHQKGIVYRDLKPENILLDRQGFIRLADFGFAKHQLAVSTRKDGNHCTTFCGSADYIAPEVLQGNGYSYACDLWSLGCVLFELLTGLPPFYCVNGDRKVLFDKILHTEPKYPWGWSRDTYDFVKRLLIKDPSKRLGCGLQGMQELVSHGFLRQVGWYDLVTKQVVPPYIPTVTNCLDTCNFEAQFTSQPVSGQLTFQSCPVGNYSSNGSGSGSSRSSIVKGKMTRTRSSKAQALDDFDGFDWCSDEVTWAF